MNKGIKPIYLIAGGLAAIMISNVDTSNVFMQGLGTIGLLCLVIGVLTGIAGLIKSKKAPPAPPTIPKQP